MSGPGYPFPEYTIEKVENNICPMPSQVNDIQDYQTCMVTMKQCANVAATRAKQRNNPQYYQYYNYFDTFANKDESKRTLNQDGDGQLQFMGGCKIFLMQNPGARNELWSSAREGLRDQLLRFHTDQNSSHGGKSPAPQVTCDIYKNKTQCL